MFWRRSTVSLGLFSGGICGRVFTLSSPPPPPPPPPPSPSLTSHLASVDVKQNVLGKSVSWLTVCGDLWRKQSWRVAGWRKDVVTRCSEFSSLPRSIDRSSGRPPPPPPPIPASSSLTPLDRSSPCLCLSVCVCVCLSLYVYVYKRN